MKINSKKFIKRRILPAIASVVVFCLVVLLIVATRKTEASADNDKVSIGTKEYTVDNPMTILEIVPENYYDSEKKELYYSDDTLNPDQMSLVCDNVSHFDVLINEDGIKWDNAKITSIVKKPQIIVSITISRMGRES